MTLNKQTCTLVHKQSDCLQHNCARPCFWLERQPNYGCSHSTYAWTVTAFHTCQIHSPTNRSIFGADYFEGGGGGGEGRGGERDITNSKSM